MVLEPILVQLLGHPLLDRYRTILKQYSLTHELSNLGVRGCVGDPTSTINESFQWFTNGCKPHLTRQFCKVELGLNSTSWYGIRVYPSTVLGLPGHSLSGRYQTILKQYSLTYKFNSLHVKRCVGDLKFNNTYYFTVSLFLLQHCKDIYQDSVVKGV